ncbi:phosphoesterase [Luteimonas sp. SX5]|uniref:Phosphoesterase n=1 Tax=Luteimonas galliterrae TaxID=2940486 RepID=A0ABT0MHN3_9GAMM|nr:phosphatase PAP2 family protein [Luteimonas galliterrae]MCL1634108.1 phosphoesterase [Luteimonas galliterrae]
MTNALARALSILGHPLLVLPAAALLLAAKAGAPGLSRLAFGLGGLAVLVLAYSWWQVRRGRWDHVDASARHERRTLNRFLLAAFAAAAAIAWTGGQHEFALGLALSALLIAVAMSSVRWCKLSLHVAFAVFAALLLANLSWQACAIASLFAAAVAWSRLALARHMPRDVAAGAAAGALAGGLFWRLLPGMAG